MMKLKTKKGAAISIIKDGRNNVYLISGENINVLIDTGRSSPDFPALRKTIEGLMIKPGKITHLIITHSHYDHCMNAKAIKDLENCEIILSRHEAVFANAGFTPLPGGTRFISNLITRLGKALGPKRFSYQPFSADILADDHLILTDGDLQLEIIETPGHTRGSISIIIDSEIALIGDAMFGVFKNSVMPPFAEDPKELVKSWGKLLKTGCDKFLPGHGNEVSRELLQREYEKYILKYHLQ